MAKYFVWRYNADAPYKCYSTRQWYEPGTTDVNCIWRGNDYQFGRDLAKSENAKNRSVRTPRSKSAQMRLI